MKKLLLIAALSVAVSPAMASKARKTALASPTHLDDIQDVFMNPAKATKFGEWLTFEFGSSATSNTLANSNPKAEGGFSRSMDASRWGFYMGHQYTFVTELRNATTFPATALSPENMINFFYASNAGDMAWGLGLGYSKTDKKTTAVKQDALALTGGILMGGWNLGLTVGLMNNYKDEETVSTSTRDFKGKTALALDASYAMDDMTYALGYAMNAAKVENGAGTEINNFDWNNWYIGAEKSVKSEGADFFYGVQYTMLTQKDKGTADTKTETSKLPLYAGIEADATSWMVLRASVKQNVLLGQTQSTTAGVGDKDTIANDTVVAAGAGLKFGKLTIDGTLEAASSATGAMNTTNLLSNGSLTYWF